jgi:two-component system probable response regulator PhcQ
MFRATVLIVDDEEGVLNGLGHTLWKTEYRLCFASDPETALDVLHDEKVDIVLSDNLMPGMSGLEFLKIVHDRYPDTIRIMLTGHADMETAVNAINQGEIYRFLLKPCDRAELLVTLHLACDKLELERENRRLLALIRSHPDLVAKLEAAQERRRADAMTE